MVASQIEARRPHTLYTFCLSRDFPEFIACRVVDAHTKLFVKASARTTLSAAQLDIFCHLTYIETLALCDVRLALFDQYHLRLSSPSPRFLHTCKHNRNRLNAIYRAAIPITLTVRRHYTTFHLISFLSFCLRFSLVSICCSNSVISTDSIFKFGRYFDSLIIT